MSKIPSIAMIPSAYKSGKVYSVLPSDGSGDFNFARASEATRVNKDGLIETVGSNVPRLNYPMIDGVVSGCPSLLLEPTRSNLYTYSEQFNQSDWSKDAVSINENQIISPDGSLIADEIIENTSTTEHSVKQLKSLIIGNYYTISVFVKKSSNQRDIYIRCGDANILVYFDTTNWQVGNEVQGSGKIENYGNGWYRLIATGLASSTGPDNFRFGLSNGTTNGSQIYTGNGVNSMYFYGAQLEEGSYATSYIPTQGSVATRDAETLSKTGLSNYINSSEGVLYFEGSAFQDIPSGNLYFSISDGSNSNSISFRLSTIGALIAYNSGLTSPDNIIATLSAGSIDLKSNFKLSIRWGSASDDFQLFVNGTKITQQVGFVFSTLSGLNELKFSLFDGSGNFYGKVKDLRVYNQALTDTELIALTQV